MASVHKDQSLPRETHEAPRPAKPSTAPAKLPRDGKDRPFDRISPLPLKIFVALMSVGLLASAILGIVIALTNRTMRRTSIIILAAGTALPLVLLFA